MGRASGNGMGAPFQAYFPSYRSGRQMQADLDKRHWRDRPTLAAIKQLQELKASCSWLSKKITNLEAAGKHPVTILACLDTEIKRARAQEAALKISR